MKRKREEVADSESGEGDLDSDEEIGWMGNEYLRVEGLDQVHAEVQEGEHGSPREPMGEDKEKVQIQKIDDEGFEEGELGELIEMALEQQEFEDNSADYYGM